MSDISGKDEKSIENRISRRRLLKSAAVGAVGLAGVGYSTRSPWFLVKAQEPVGNWPAAVSGNTVTFGFNVPLTGAYADEGADELRAYELAVKHLNEGGGMLETLKPSALTGNGVLGKRVEYVTGDTQTDPDAARAGATRMIERDGAIMFSGGSSSAVAIAQQYLAQSKKVLFMVGLSHSNDTTGKDRVRYGFRHFFNAYMSGKALSPVLAEEYGRDRRAFHLTADYTWGHTQYESMKEFTEEEGWTTVRNIMTPLGTKDYSSYLTAVLNSDADVLILNHYGLDMVNSINNAMAFGFRNRVVNGKQFEIVVPLFSRLMATGAGPRAIDGVLGTSSWNAKLPDEGSQAFAVPFEAEYGFPPSQAAHVAYVQTLLYANAVERVGSFYPPEVIRALEDFEYSGMGPNPELMRGCDHQAFHDILVVRGKGKAERENEFDQFEIVSRVPRARVEYPCDLMPGDLGPYL